MGMKHLERKVEGLLDRAEQLDQGEDLVERFAPYRDRPVAFVEEVLSAKPQTYQTRLLEALTEDTRVAWRAGHGVGKTTTLSWTLLWWLLSRPYSRVLVLAPAFERQVGRYLFPEVRKWCRSAPTPLPIQVRGDVVEVTAAPKSWFALAVQASDPAKVEGGHSESLCVLADEAKGLSAEVIAALHGTQTATTGDRLYLLASVPGAPSGPFYEAFRNGLWRGFHTSAADSALVSDRWVEERRQEWGEQSPIYQARVLGEFPEEDEGTLIKLSDLEAATEREITWPPGEAPALSFGLDVARFGGDRTVLAIWQGQQLLELHSRQGLDTMATAAWVSSEINRRHPVAVVVDEIGVGSGVVDRLLQLGHAEVVGLNVGSSASRNELFANTRAEIFWSLRESFERGEVSLPEHEGLLAELSALRYGYTPGGKILLERKDETKRRVGRSPDLADAVALGFSAASGVGQAQPTESEIVWDPSGMFAPGGLFGLADPLIIPDDDIGRHWREW